MAGPLDGERVLEFTQILAGPIAGVHLSDLGAEVVKVEAPGGEPFRHSNAVVPGEAKMFHWLNRGKQSLVIDLKDERAQELIRRNAARGVFGVTDDPSEPPVEDATAPEYLAKVAELKEHIKAQMRSRTSDEWMDVLEVAGVPAAPVNFGEEMADDPHTVAEGVIIELEHEIVGKQRFVGPLVEMSESQPVAQGPSPPLGKHTDAVLTGGGVSVTEIAALRVDGVLA